MRHKRVIFFLAVSLAVNTSFGQAAEELKKYKEKYAGEAVIYLNRIGALDISIGKTGELEITRRSVEDRMYLNNSGKDYSDDDVKYSTALHLNEISAYSLVPVEDRYKKIKVKNFTTRDVMSGSVFFDDNKSIGFFYPSIGEGVKTHLEYEIGIKEPRFLTSFYFGSFIHVDNTQYSMEVDNDVEMDFAYFNSTAEELNFTKEVGKNRTSYSWSSTENKKYKVEAESPPVQAFLPHVVPKIKSYKFKGRETKILEDLKDLHRWYAGLLGKVNTKESMDIKALVDSITKGAESEYEKVKQIYYWVQDNIKYIAFEANMDGFIPKPAAEVCKNKYGDCKGMSSLTNEMLKMAGIKSYFTWIGSRDIPYRYKDLVSPIVDNHMIVTYIDGDNYYFLDATGSVVALELTTGFIQGKEALIHIDSTHYIVREVPIANRSTNLEIDTTRLKITTDGMIKGTTVYQAWGLNASELRSAVSKKSVKERKKFVEKFYTKGNNKCNIESVKFNNVRNRDLPIDLAIEFTIEDYVTVSDDELFINLHLSKSSVKDKIDKERENAIVIDHKYTSTMNVFLEIPAGYEISYVPESTSASTDFNGYYIRYEKVSPTLLRMEEQVYEDYLELSTDKFSAWNDVRKSRVNSYSEVVILKKIN